MKVVLYNHEMEPITIIKISDWMLTMIRNDRTFITLQVDPPLDWRRYTVEELNQPRPYRTVEIEVVPLYMSGGFKTFFLRTRDEESALLLESAFLPGQTKELNDLKEEAYTQGFARAFRMMR